MKINLRETSSFVFIMIIYNLLFYVLPLIQVEAIMTSQEEFQSNVVVYHYLCQRVYISSKSEVVSLITSAKVSDKFFYYLFHFYDSHRWEHWSGCLHKQ